MIENDYEQRYAGFNPNSSESYIIFEFLQDKNMEKSVELATLIQKQFKTTAKRIDKGVHQAGFLVLRETTMPGVLVELGYISNPEEEQYLLSNAGSSALAKSIYQAFISYKSKQTGVTPKETAVVERKAPTRVETPVCPGSCRDCTLPVCVNSAESKNTAVESGRAAGWNVDAVTAATNVTDTKYVDAESAVSVADIDAITAATAVDAQSGATAMTDGNSGATSLVATTEFDSWQRAYENVAAIVPHFETITVADGTVSVKLSNFGNMRAADKYMFDTANGKITGVQLYKDSARKGKISGWFYSLHIGSWGGLFTRILSFLAALLGATLPITGYYFWIRRLYGKRKSKL